MGKKLALKCEPAEEVKSVKEKLVREHNFMSEGLKLIYKGAVTKDDDTLETIKFDEKATFVLVGKRKNSIVADTVAKRRKIESTPPPPTTSSTSTAQPIEAPALTRESTTTPPPSASVSTPDAPVQERFPTNELERVLQQAILGRGQGGNNILVRDLNEADLAGFEEEGESFSEGEDGEVSGLEEIIQGLNEIKERLALDPTQLPVILEELKVSHPELYNEVEDDPETFLAFINGDDSAIPMLDVGEPSETGGVAAAPAATDLSSHDREAIDRLAALAQVPVEVAAQAYIAMGKSEEAAANMLFD
eukprot:TRINITY_DN6467_c0_g1_i2.p1 TRINITY_DN6467_c0_g1~~TRINITY_DN6467_c0_g1_i2.p1  ORF type:complete len:305 (+),score=62.12 TRINITY_DN6467_c0_g1_i2:65-979(+)